MAVLFSNQCSWDATSRTIVLMVYYFTYLSKHYTVYSMLVKPSPDGHYVGKEQQEAEDLKVPAASEVLQSHHDQRDHHQSSEQNLGQAVNFQVKKANLQHQMGIKYRNFQIKQKHV